MISRSMLSVACVAGVLALAGCNGPTKAGKEARAAANDRMSLVGAQIHFDQARQFFRSGQFDKAEREIGSAIARHDKAAEYYVLQGRIHLETHRLEQALESFKTATAKDATLAEAHYFTGIVFQRWSDDEQAYQSYSTAFELDSNNVQYLLAAAESLIALGEFDQAQQLIEPKITYFEHNAALRQLEGQIALLQGDAPKAAELYAEARVLNPDDDLLLEELTWAQYAAGMYGPCLESVKRLAERAKQERTDLIHLEARCLTMMNRGSEARELYVKLTKLRPADVLAWSELGTLAWDLGDYRRVAQCSAQLIALAPERYEGYMFKGINERERGDLNQAAKLFAQAAERAPESALPHLLLGQTLEQAGKIEAARLAYGGAVTAEPDSVEARELLRRLNEGAERESGAAVAGVTEP